MRLLTWLPVVWAVYERLDRSQSTLYMNGFVDSYWGIIDVFDDGYDYRLGGNDWPGLCQTGREQSPINLRTFPDPSFQLVSPQNSSFQPLLFANPLTTPAVMDLGFFNVYWLYSGTVETDVGALESEQIIDSFALHAPSEHSIDGIKYPLSIQLMYTNVAAGGIPTGGYQVEVMYREGRRSALLDQLINEDPLDMTELFPADGLLQDYFFYMGSWNYPPGCAEEVTWVVPNYAVEAAYDQIQYFTDLYVNNLNFTEGRGTARVIQPLYDRIVSHFVNI